jgi:GTP cyclohydrolase II
MISPNPSDPRAADAASAHAVPTSPAPHGHEPVRIVSIAELPTRFGTFRAVAFTADGDGKEHLAIVRGSVRGRSRVPVRVHSECLTGDVLGSLRCDCRDQLIAALEHIGSLDAGIVLYLRQEGRGIGLTNKIRAYALQDQGYDTVDANRMLGFGDDERDYRVAAEMIDALGVRSIRLMTNNPAKVDGLRALGVKVAGRLPHVMTPNRHNQFYLVTKQRRAGHWLGLSENAHPEPAPSKPRAGIGGVLLNSIGL